VKQSRLDLPHIKLQIANGLANGHSQREIAGALGTSQPTISRMAAQPDVKKLIKREETKLLRRTEKVLEQIRYDPRFLAEFQKALEKEILDFRWLRQR
jgi:DNA-binding MarR family transcriptional regulator